MLMKKAVRLGSPSGGIRTAGLMLVLVCVIAGIALPAVAGSFVSHNTPRYVNSAKNLGPENPDTTIEVSVWLKPHNQSQLDALTRQIYDRNSPNFRHFLQRSEFSRTFAPSAAEIAQVKKFLESQNLKTVRLGPDNLFIRARGAVRDVQTAFHVQLNNYNVLGKIVRANASDPYIDDESASLVSSVSGLDTGEYEHPLMQRPVPPSNKKGVTTAAASAAALSPSATAAPGASLFSSVCFNGTEKETFSTDGLGLYPIGTYSGNHLNLQTLTSNGCAYTPPAIQAAYNLSGLYKEGYNGAGQTIGIIDWCGSLTIQSDANAFSKEFGLPPLTSSNFAITYIPTISSCEATDQVEINLDVEWAHSVAPGANINLIVPPSASFQDVNEAEYTAVNYGLATVISGSYGSIESLTPASELANESLISEIAAAEGISTNFATGDTGDFTVEGIPATVLAPADSPWATGVGGISLALNSSNVIQWQAGWGNNQTVLAEEGEIFVPPLAAGFTGGSGGGPSNCATQDSNGDCIAGFPKPSFQKALPGKVRLLPDVSWLADPYTGVPILISVPGQVPEQVWQIWGGTSLATPMFSALWAIANQEAGAPLGDAAPYLYSMPKGTIDDIVPVTSSHNVTAAIQTSASATTHYTPGEVLGGTQPGNFVSAIWDFPDYEATPLAVSFSTDCTTVAEGPVTQCTSPTALRTHAGWDNVTGVGVPNGKAFADSFHP
jgi:subtilase family serine protease